jgi:hypothetical protein
VNRVTNSKSGYFTTQSSTAYSVLLDIYLIALSFDGDLSTLLTKIKENKICGDGGRAA